MYLIRVFLCTISGQKPLSLFSLYFIITITYITFCKTEKFQVYSSLTLFTLIIFAA